MSEAHLEIGVTVADRYVVEALIGTGGLAEVYRVRHVDLGSVYALKLLTLRRKGYDERLKLEGQIQANLRHPNVVNVTDIVRVDGQFGLLMEYVEGSSLDALLAEQGKLEYVAAMSLFAPVLAAVAWAHDSGAVHRDLKPGNILLARTPVGWVPKVADFGIGKLVDAASGETGGGRTRSGVAMGTPGYMAPEQVRDSAKVDKSADVFALGIIFYEMLQGRLPFLNDDGTTDLTTTLVRDATPLDVPGVPVETAEAIAKAMSKEPEQRFPDARSLAMALGLSSHPLFADGSGNLRDITRSVATSWTGPRSTGGTPKVEPSGGTLAPATGTSPTTTFPPPVAVPAAPARGTRWVLLAVPVAGGILALALLALVVSGGMVALELTRDGGPAVVAPDPDPAPASAVARPADPGVPPPGDAVVDAAVDPVGTPPAPATPVPAVIPSPTATPGSTPLIVAPTPSGAQPEVVAPEPVAVVVIPEPVPSAAPAPVVEPTPKPALPTAPVPNVAGSWSGKAAGRPFDLVVAAAGTGLTADAIFVTGATRRVEKLVGAIDPATGAVTLRSSDGRIRFDGKVEGATLSGTYMQEGNRPLAFSVSR